MRRLEVDEHLPYEDAPAPLGVPVLDLGEPSLQRDLLVLPGEQQLERVPLHHVLQHPDPLLRVRGRVRGQVEGLGGRGDLEGGGGGVGAGHAAVLVQGDHALGLAVKVVLKNEWSGFKESKASDGN